jgi:nucleoid DNA-binding protein
MIKADITKKVAAEFSMDEERAAQIVDSIIDSLMETIDEDGRLELREFGVFQVKQRKARVGRNPKNKKEYPIPARKVVTFKPGKDLKSI